MKQPDVPLVSVVTPAYNAAAFIRETIESVRSQDYPAIEHIVMDGGSTDGTVDILAEYPHLTWASERDRGQSDALNKGFRRARGEVIGWLNADDTYQPGAIKAAVAFLEAHPEADMIYSDCRVIDGAGQAIDMIRAVDFTPRSLLLSHTMPQQTLFFRRKVIESTGGVSETLHYVMDWELCIRVSAQFRVRRLPDTILGNFRICPGTKTSEGAPQSTLEFLGVLEKALTMSPYRELPPSDRRLIRRRARSRYHMAICFSAHAHGDRSTVAKALPRGIYFDPRWLSNLGVISIGFEAVLGHRLANSVRQILRPVAGVLRSRA